MAKRDFAYIIKLSILKWGDLPGLCEWAQCNHNDPCNKTRTELKVENTKTEARNCSAEIKEPAVRDFLETEQREEMRIPSNIPEGTSLGSTLILAQ